MYNNDTESVPFRLLESFISMLMLLAGQVMKLVDILIHPALFSWLTLTGTSLLIIVWHGYR